MCARCMYGIKEEPHIRARRCFSIEILFYIDATKKTDFFIYGFQFLNSDFFTYLPIHYIVINYNGKIIIDKSKKRTYHIVNVYCHGSRHYAG